MSKITSLTKRRAMRHARVRSKVKGTAERPRLYVFRSNKYVYGALVNDVVGITLAAVSTKDEKIKKGESSFTKVSQATEAGKKLAKLAQEKGVTAVVFDRGGYRYTGRVAALAEGARVGGLIF